MTPLENRDWDRATAMVRAIADEVRAKMPSAEEMDKLLSGEDLGPQVSIPAVWMHLILLRMDSHDLEMQVNDCLLHAATMPTAGSA